MTFFEMLPSSLTVCYQKRSCRVGHERCPGAEKPVRTFAHVTWAFLSTDELDSCEGNVNHGVGTVNLNVIFMFGKNKRFPESYIRQVCYCAVLLLSVVDNNVLPERS